jgi:Tle cognate immunity protein 4 C-terminal domain/Tle cognate immunity protein 4 N-terminal domain
MPARTVSSGRARLQGIEFVAEPMTRDEYGQGLDERAAALRAIANQFVYADGEAGSTGTRYFISRGKPHDPRDATRVIDAYKWHEGYRIMLKVVGRDDMTGMADDSFHDDIGEKAQRVFALLSRVRGRPDDEIPTTPGVCFPGGFLAGEASGPERIETRFTLEDQLDVTFSLTTDSEIRKTDTFLQRGSDIESGLKATSGGRTLRRGAIDLPDGLRAEEWLTTGLMPLKVLGHIFELECNPVTSGAGMPLVTLDMHNGGIPANIDWSRPPERASLAEDEALALWDAISRTLRRRPNGF